MAKNIFLDKNQYVPKPKRNAYDKSKLVNGTYSEGYLYPVNWEEVTFGDSIKIDIRAALRTMPLVWPIQTPILVKFYSFYVRYRTLWDNFQDFRFNNKQCVHPYIASRGSSSMWKTGGIADHLGVPSTMHSDVALGYSAFSNPPTVTGIEARIVQPFTPFYRVDSVNITNNKPISEAFSYDVPASNPRMAFFSGNPITPTMADSTYLYIHRYFVGDATKKANIYIVRDDRPTGGTLVVVGVSASTVSMTLPSGGENYMLDISRVAVTNKSGATGVVTTSISSFLHSFDGGPFDMTQCNYHFIIYDGTSGAFQMPSDYDTLPILRRSLLFDSPVGAADVTEVFNPFGGNNPVVPISALPFRAYEAIYRSYFQDLVNEPFIIDGVAQYNRYVTELSDGADYTPYHLFRRNWEADFLTSCKPSPQQGLAPIVGITSDGNITLVKGDGEEYTVHVNTDNGDVIQSIDFASESSPSDSSVRRTLLELASSGITINSLRNTNAFQKWVEANYRRGLKFKDQVLSNFGVNIEYKELDMPEFLGGFTVPLNVNTVNQTTPTDSSPLGKQGANAGAYGASNHSITHYCDEEGLVMTLMCITPIPIYSQILNRTWLKSTPVDYFNVQFGKIGNQPVTYEEVCPIQAANEGRDVHDVFGYQRPWYHLISSVDEAHGFFRTNMSSFLQMRVFGSTPELGADFLHIDASQLNDVFVINDREVSDAFYGQIGFNIYKKTSIPRFNLPQID